MTSFNLPLYLSLFISFCLIYRVYRNSALLSVEGALKKRAIFIIRLAVVWLLILALFDVRYPLGYSGINYIVAIDNSWSMRDNLPKAVRSASAILEKALDGPGREAQYLSFGEKASLEKINMTKDRLFFRPPRAEVGQAGSNFENLLDFSTAVSKQDAVNRVILFTDGEETSGNYKNAAGRLRSSGIEVYPYYYETVFNYDVILTSINLPAAIAADRKFEGRVVVELRGADFVGGSELRIFRDNALIGNFRVDLNRGFNAFKFEDRVGRIGYSKYTAFIEQPLDKNVHNNTMYGYADVSGPPSLLAVSEKEKQAGIKKLLSSMDLDFNVITPDSLGYDIEEYMRYNAIALNDVPARALKARQMAILKKYVTDLGGGLIIGGGDTSYGNGGYMATQLEDLAPVTMDVNDKAKLISCAIIFVIDKSGSMSENSSNYENDGACKIDLAKEAVIASINLLQSKDIAGVIAFDSEAKWVVMPEKLDDRDALARKVSELVASGGTSMYGALGEAYKEIRGKSVTAKHIVVLSDGITMKDDFAGLVSKFKDDKITLSAVALGRDADVPFLSELSRAGMGRFYYSEDASDLPSIFIQETLKSSRNFIIEEKFAPKVVNTYPLFNGISAGEISSMPQLKGYVAATAKPNAAVYMKSPKGDPLLASLQCGLGRTAGFTFDLYGRWSDEFSGWSGFGRLFKNTVKYVLRHEFSPNIECNVERSGDTVNLTFKTTDADKRLLNFLDSELSVAAPGGGQETVEVVQTRVGTYQASFKLSKEGTYFLSLKQTGKNGEAFHTVFGCSYPYSNEYLNSGRGRATLEDMAASTGGAMITEKNLGKLISNDAAKFSKRRLPLRDYLLELAIFLFLFEIFLWRVDFSAETLLKIRKYLGSFLENFRIAGGAPESTGHDERIGRLLKVKMNKGERGESGRMEPLDFKPSGVPEHSGSVSGAEVIKTPPDPGKSGKSDGIKTENASENGEEGGFTRRLLKIKKKK